MKPGAGKGKGSSFERLIAEKLSLWLSNGAMRDIIWRSESSGARFTCSNGKTGTAGDLMAKHPLAFEFCAEFVCECKHWADLNLLTFLNCKGELYDAFTKVKREANGKSFLLICRQNNRPITVLAYFANDTIRQNLLTHVSHILFTNIFFFQLDWFLEKFKPEDIIPKGTLLG